MNEKKGDGKINVLQKRESLQPLVSYNPVHHLAWFSDGNLYNVMLHFCPHSWKEKKKNFSFFIMDYFLTLFLLKEWTLFSQPLSSDPVDYILIVKPEHSKIITT